MERRKITGSIYREMALFHQARRCSASALKRVADVVLSVVFLILFSPVLAAAAILIRLTSEGPVFFIQERVGLNGAHFRFIKLRSMRHDADPLAHEEYAEALIKGFRSHTQVGNETVYKIANDRRITRVGRVIRKLSIDEIPQFINVLRGEMSIVGPRPPIPHELKFYTHRAQKRLMVKPGITGMWQVNGRSTTTFERMLTMDLYYIDHWSIGLDMQIIFKTFVAVFDISKAY